MYTNQASKCIHIYVYVCVYLVSTVYVYLHIHVCVPFRVHFRIRYLSPVRGSRTLAWAEKTMNETLILGLKNRSEQGFVLNKQTEAIL